MFTNTSQLHKILFAVVAVLLLVGPSLFVLKNQMKDRSQEVTPTEQEQVNEIHVPVPSPTDTPPPSILSDDLQQEFASIQSRINSGELSEEESQALLDEFSKKLPPPVPREVTN